MAAPVFIALLHYPMTNRKGETVTTAVTNLDIHDIARSARTYGAQRYFIVTPIEDQHALVNRILTHWRTDRSREYHPDRFEALSRIELVRDFKEVREFITKATGENPEVVLTDARPEQGTVSYGEMKKRLSDQTRTRPVLIVFGTGWGLSPLFYSEVDTRLDPVFGSEGEGGYNHLSVRSAVAVILDRLFGK